MKNNFRNCLSFWENKLFSTKFIEQIIYYTLTKIKLSIPTHCVGLRLVISSNQYLSTNAKNRQVPLPFYSCNTP